MALKNYLKKMVSFVGVSLINPLLKRALTTIERKRDAFITLHERPIHPSKLRLLPKEPGRVLPKSAVVIQGPIQKTDDFTLETIKLYKRNFEQSVIIVSTWKEEDPTYLKLLEEAGAVVVTGEKPKHPAPKNLNFQIVSAALGIEKAKALGAEYVIKTRTDQRMYGRHLMEFLINLVELFPVAPESKQKRRLVGVGGGALKFNIYHFSDVFNFGHIDDMLVYWRPKLISPDDHELGVYGDKKLISESYLITEFLKHHGLSPVLTIDDWWRSAARYTVLIDTSSLDLYWNKYARNREYKLISYLYPVHEISLAEWFNIYARFDDSGKEKIFKNGDIETVLKIKPKETIDQPPADSAEKKPPLKLNSLLKRALTTIERKRDAFITLHERPIHPSKLRLLPKEPGRVLPKSAVVIQGPIQKTDDFTLETIKLYKRNFEQSVIIVSTWKEEDPTYLKLLEEAGAVVVTGEKPENGGLRNTNLQIVSTALGMEKAKELGAEYVIKTRTDQRMYGRHLMEFLINLVELFPPAPESKQKRRLVGVSINTKLDILYHVSDIFQFGATDDLVKYWARDLIKEKQGETTKFPTGDHMSTEGQLFTRFLNRIGEKHEPAREEFLKTVAEQCIIIDEFSLDLYWNKYNRHREYRNVSYSHPVREINFIEWLNLYADNSLRKRHTN